jgi:cytochrome c peroxidase
MRIPLHPYVTPKTTPTRSSSRWRHLTTLNTPARDKVRSCSTAVSPTSSHRHWAITDHAQATRPAQRRELDLIARFQQLAPRFFTSLPLEVFSLGGPAPRLPLGRTASEKRGRTFFEDVPPDFSVTPPNFKVGACAACHSGPMLNQTNQFLPLPLPPGSRFQTVLVSEFNAAGNPVIDFVFHNQENDVLDGNPDGIIELSSPDPGHALITGRADDTATFTFDHANLQDFAPARHSEDRAATFPDNSAKTLEDVLNHYQQFFLIVSDADGPGPQEPVIQLNEQDKKDIIAFIRSCSTESSARHHVEVLPGGTSTSTAGSTPGPDPATLFGHEMAGRSGSTNVEDRRAHAHGLPSEAASAASSCSSTPR